MKIQYLIPFVVLLAACDPLTGPDLKAKASSDVQVARAANITLSILSDPAGTTSPSGTVTVKEGITAEIEGTAQPEFVLVGWKQTGGSGSASFTPVSTTKVAVKVTGGSATVAPVYAPRPSVLYMLPGGNNVAKNISIRVVFNTKVGPFPDLASVKSFFLLRDQNSVDVDFASVGVDGSNTVVLKPTSGLNPYNTYIITANAGIPLNADFNSSFYDGVTFLNKTVASRNQIANSFTTGEVDDSTPPFSGSFILKSIAGDAVYTKSAAPSTTTVSLSSINSEDDSGPGGVASAAYYYSAGAAGARVAGDFNISYTYGMALTLPLASNTEGQHTIKMLFRDQSGNMQAYSGLSASGSIYLDSTPPTVSALTIGAGSGTQAFGSAPMFISGQNSSFSLAATDPNLLNVASVKGSGESTDGTNSVERKTVQFSNDNINYSAPAAFSTTGTWQLATGGDGLRTVYVKVADAVGNASSAFQTTTQIYVDSKPPSVTVAGSSGILYAKANPLVLAVVSSDAASGLNTYSLTRPTDGRTPAFAANVAPAAYGAANGATYPVNVTLDTSTQGAKAFDINVFDKVGNARTRAINAVYDSVAPTPNVASNPFVQSVSPTNLSTLNVNLAPTDATSGMAFVYWAVVTGAAPAIGSATKVDVTGLGASYSLPVSWTPVGVSETKTLYLWFEDRSGNVNGPVQVSQAITYNNNAPLGTVSIPVSPLVPKKGLFSVDWTGVVAGTGLSITKVEISNDGNTWKNLNRTSAVNTNISGTVASFDPKDTSYGGSAANGTRYVYLRLSGSNGSQSILTTSYTFDDTPPYVYYYTVTGSGGTTSTNQSTVTVTFWLYDNITAWSGYPSVATNTYDFSVNGGAYGGPVSETTYSNSVTVALTGAVSGNNSTVTMRGRDEAGNETIVSANILYDTTPPTPGTLSGNPGTTYDRVLTLTGNPTDSGSGLDQMETWSDGNYSGLQPYSPNVSFLLTPLNGTKTIYVHYRDKAGNDSGWIGPFNVTLNSQYYNLNNGNWHNIVGANYANPASRAAVQSNSYISGTSSLNLTAGSQGPRSYVYVTNAGQVGWFDYYISGTSVTFYYQTFNSAGTAITNPWASGSINLPASGNFARLDLDNPAWLTSLSNTYLATHDFYFYNSGGTIYLIPYSGMRWTLF